MCIATEHSPKLQELRSTLAEHATEIEAREFLSTTWWALNRRCFGGSLRQVPAFLLSDFADDLGVMGQFVGGDDGCLIMVHKAFFFEGGTVSKQDREIAAGLIVLHETVHQRRREKGCRDRDCHGAGFVREANRLSRIMGLHEHVSIEGDCQSRYWPFDTEPGLALVTGKILDEYRAACAV